MEFDASVWSFDGNLFFTFAGEALHKQADKSTADHWVEHLFISYISIFLYISIEMQSFPEYNMCYSLFR